MLKGHSMTSLALLTVAVERRRCNCLAPAGIKMLKKIGCCHLLALFLVIGGVLKAGDQDHMMPNIVLILADDLGFADLST
jgi:hypothetical protein